MFEVVFFPIYGLVLGVNYWNSDMDEVPEFLHIDEEEEEKTYMIQLFFLFAGISVIWYD